MRKKVHTKQFFLILILSNMLLAGVVFYILNRSQFDNTYHIREHAMSVKSPGTLFVKEISPGIPNIGYANARRTLNQRAPLLIATTTVFFSTHQLPTITQGQPAQNAGIYFHIYKNRKTESLDTFAKEYLNALIALDVNSQTRIASFSTITIGEKKGILAHVILAGHERDLTIPYYFFSKGVQSIVIHPYLVDGDEIYLMIDSLEW